MRSTTAHEALTSSVVSDMTDETNISKVSTFIHPCATPSNLNANFQAYAYIPISWSTGATVSDGAGLGPRQLTTFC